MFMRWKRYKLIKKEGYSLQAVLLRGVRNGKTMRQEFIKYLGSIRQQRIETVRGRIIFWKKVNQSLSTLNLDPESKRTVVNMIREKVPIPRQAEIQEYLNGVSKMRAISAKRKNRDDARLKTKYC